ncbi:hypothetical protein BGZ82_009811 [Podila clonocystis]|nr:hypothetical protein BGZ82_009811 [Podila clonocystis]
MAKNMISGAAPTWVFGSSTDDHSHTTERYHSAIDQARTFAAELGPDFASAFDKLSHKTALVLRAYVVTLHQEGHSYHEIKDVRDTMRQYFDNALDCCGTDWQFLPDSYEIMVAEENEDKDVERGEWIGNPVFDSSFINMMQEIQLQDKRADGSRLAKRRTSIGYNDMAKLMQHLQKPEVIKTEGAGRCLFIQAFAAIAFTLWLTFEEVLRLKRGHIRLQPSDTDGLPWFSVTVPFRASNPIDPSKANAYEIYSRPDEPHACCVTKLLAWIQWQELNAGHALRSEDLLFSELSNDHRINLQRAIPVTQASALLNQYANEAGLMDHRYNRLDTHCFRRGGSQHRLTHAQDPWPFKAVKWWGGWPETEPVEEITEYLWDDFQYDTGFGDMMSPHRRKSQEHGDAAMLMLKGHIESSLSSMESRHAAELAVIKKEVQEIKQQNQVWKDMMALLLEKALASQGSLSTHPPYVKELPNSLLQHPGQKDLSERSNTQPLEKSETLQHQPEEIQLQPYQPALQPHQNSEPISTPIEKPETLQQQPEDLQLQSYQPSLQPHQNSEPISIAIEKPETLQQQPEDLQLQSYQPSLQPHQNSEPISIAIEKPETLQQQPEYFHPQPYQQTLLPHQNSELPRQHPRKKLQNKHLKRQPDQNPKQFIPRIRNWKEAIEQWEKGDPSHGLTVPLRDWDADMRRRSECQTTYCYRKLIVKEFDNFGRDENRMRHVYGDVMDGTAPSLVQAIYKRHRLEEEGKKKSAKRKGE